MSIEVSEGLALQEAAIQQLLIYRKGLIAQCRAAMVALYRERASRAVEPPWVNGDDACRWLDAQGCRQDYRLVGAVFRAKSGWVFVMTVNSGLKRRHHRRISCWRWAGGEDGRQG